MFALFPGRILNVALSEWGPPIEYSITGFPWFKPGRTESNFIIRKVTSHLCSKIWLLWSARIKYSTRLYLQNQRCKLVRTRCFYGANHHWVRTNSVRTEWVRTTANHSCLHGRAGCLSEPVRPMETQSVEQTIDHPENEPLAWRSHPCQTK